MGEVKPLSATQVRLVAPAEICHDSTLRRYMMVYSPLYNVIRVSTASLHPLPDRSAATALRAPLPSTEGPLARRGGLTARFQETRREVMYPTGNKEAEIGKIVSPSSTTAISAKTHQRLQPGPWWHGVLG